MRLPVALVLIAALVGAVQPGCERIGGRTVEAEFRSVEGLQSGRPVYLAGVQIGATGAPVIVAGRAQVPVYVWRTHRDALPAGSVFAIVPDPNEPDARCLVVYEIPTAKPRDENGVQIYPGASSELELAVLMGAEKARELWELLGQK